MSPHIEIFSQKIYGEKNENYTIFKLIGNNSNIGLSQLNLKGLYSSNNLTIQIPFFNVSTLSCQNSPPDLGIVINNDLIPINRENDYLFDIALRVDNLTNSLKLDFVISNQNSPFSLSYDQISNSIYILKFKIIDPTKVTDNPPITIFPINVLSPLSLNYTSFTVTPNIKKSTLSQYSNITFYTNDKYSYVLFNTINDNNHNFVPVFTNNNQSNLITTAYPLYSAKNISKFIGYFKNVTPLSEDLLITLELLTNDDTNTTDPILSGSFTNLPYPFGGGTGPFISSMSFTLNKTNLQPPLEFPKSYSIQTIFDWKYINSNQSYIPYWCISSFTPNSLTFQHEMLIPQNFFDDSDNNKFYYRKASFYGNNYSDVNLGPIQNQYFTADKTLSIIITDILLISINEFGYTLRLFIQDQSTYSFSFLTINDQTITAISMASDGILEYTVNESFVISMNNSFTIMICDTIYNCQNNTYYPKTFESLKYNPFPSLIIPKCNNLVDANPSSTNRNNIIYIQTNTSTNYPIYFRLNKHTEPIPFRWNQTLGLFQCLFTIPKNYLNGNLNYFIILNDREYSYSNIYSVIGTNSSVEIQTNNSDISPPLVQKIVAIPGTSVNISKNSNSFGWDIIIEDQFNGFSNGEINITSELDPVGYSFKITPNDLVDGKIYQIRINQNINCSSQTYTVTSVFLRDQEGYETSYSSDETISALFKVAYSNEKSIRLNCETDIQDTTPPDLAEFALSPNFYDYSNPNSIINITFTVSDEHISSNQVPNIIFEDKFGSLYIGCDKNNIIITEKGSDSIKYNCMVKFPFGFGYPNGATVSIYGIVDDFMNAAGFGPMALSNKFQESLDPTIRMVLGSSTPIISSASPTLTNNGSNLILSMDGAFFGIDPSLVSFSVASDSNQGVSKTRKVISTNNPSLPYNIDFFSGTKIIMNIDISKLQSKNIQITLSINGVYSNIYKFIIPEKETSSDSSESNESIDDLEPPAISSLDFIQSSDSSHNSNSVGDLTLAPEIITDSSSLLPSLSSSSASSSSSIAPSSINNNSNSDTQFDCNSLNNCGGALQGKCIAHNTCKCINKWVGIKCTSKPLEGVSISYNINKPTATFFQGTGISQLYSLISLYQLREINITGQIIREVDLQKEWKGEILDSKSPEQYLYTTEIPNVASTTNATIQSILSIYSEESIFNFAGTDYDIIPNSIKFTINITNYQFQSIFNTLELILQAKLNSSQRGDICSKKIATLANDSDLLSIQINDKSLYCRFLNTALLDGTRKINISHINRNNEFNVTLQSNSGQYFYGIELPQFTNISIDPDFSLLLENNVLSGSDLNSTCSGHKRKLSNNAIAGIVVGGFAALLVLIIIATSIIFRKYRFSNFTMNIRKWRSRRRSNDKNYKMIPSASYISIQELNNDNNKDINNDIGENNNNDNYNDNDSINILVKKYYKNLNKQNEIQNLGLTFICQLVPTPLDKSNDVLFKEELTVFYRKFSTHNEIIFNNYIINLNNSRSDNFINNMDNINNDINNLILINSRNDFSS
ncbi:hypothetical protein DICPUDRAFT_154367 [Dictyostelium purpureum]|uniref:EGF-like domain-containing protein n=1 Tax=Dictyostelium purpureum TaxID=5786 RepID=F0ZR62_DICPU|nr:uncharacterized protein DICPUDRAFT_154367 [Dictyostelium purpureum]EGC33563.1 hypothetical protein DICPUDRAFT_154367 [Dictyostelium purpureum]|eukprot:XP_003289912.1 hypothetical protein DICPUDRAFT_154367 [Dictyostelium purpureum]